jgi:hypothetical protein
MRKALRGVRMGVAPSIPEREKEDIMKAFLYNKSVRER